MKIASFSASTPDTVHAQFRPHRPRQRVNREAHLLIPPLRQTNAASGSAFVLYSAAYRITTTWILFACRPSHDQRWLILLLEVFNKRVDDDLYGVKHCSLHPSKCPAISYARRGVRRADQNAPVAREGEIVDLHRRGTGNGKRCDTATQDEASQRAILGQLCSRVVAPMNSPRCVQATTS